MNVKLVTRPGKTTYIQFFEARTGIRCGRTYDFADPILARASAIELATSRGWHIVSKDWGR